MSLVTEIQEKKKGLEKRNVFKALRLVAGAGFEPTTFGL